MKKNVVQNFIIKRRGMSNVTKQRDPMEVLVEIIMEDRGNKSEEQEDDDDVPCALEARGLRRSSGGSLHMRSYCVCNEEKLARRQSRSSMKLTDTEGEKRK